jgi:N6-L-threonylcarbamoyladenine synthase
MLVLGIESSCDETAAAVTADGTTLLSSVVDSQVDIHSRYGGVVPELASRRHIETIYPVVQAALTEADLELRQINGLAATRGPGLIGSLLVGFSFVKAMSLATGLPYVGVDHMAGHLLSVFLGQRTPDFPYIALVASGGHSSIFQVIDPYTYHLLGRTRDDAAGEAFDKVAKLLGLGYPGGPLISSLAAKGNPQSIAFPRAWLEPDSLDFSFSGLKTSVVNLVSGLTADQLQARLYDICASFQEAVAEVLVEKTMRAARMLQIDRIVLAGGVAANERLRLLLLERGSLENFHIFLTPPTFCTDNAAMIALAGTHLLRRGDRADQQTDVYSRTPPVPENYSPTPSS